MPESEIPYEFLVDPPERRKHPRRQDDNCHDTCERLLGVENRVTLLANEFYTYKRTTAAETKEANVERKEILLKLDRIDTHLDKQKGFFAGAVWAGSAVVTFIIAAIGAAISYFKP